ncbi:cytochrome P450 [Exidia glandulosa HHB12029]|uniref:Cytochrome P450 n=1 Tax=Exidia glandulosa HHB12029 TaxID=1314781 RepID=A0A165GFQ6_EXIGL|nr:cytochrome P450 [Exidia glandulosa HHB12029]
MPSTLQLLAAVSVPVFGYIASQLLAFRRARNTYSEWLLGSYVFGSVTILGNLLPHVPFVIYGKGVRVRPAYHKRYQKLGWDAEVEVTMSPKVAAAVTICDAEVIKLIASSNARFPKPVELYELLLVFGSNIVASSGDLWKRHRRIAAPAFSERNNRLVWDESIRVVDEVFESWGSGEVHISDAKAFTLNVTLLVLSIASFGKRISWDEKHVAPPGYRFTFGDALHIVSERMVYKVLVPASIQAYTIPRIRDAFEDFTKYMKDMVHRQRVSASSQSGDEKYDLLSGLVTASNAEDETGALSEEELLGNVFMFLLAGHETSRHSLAITLTLLALHQDEQAKLHDHVAGLLEGRASFPGYDQYGIFTRAVAVLYEGLRLYPAVLAVPKKTAEPTTFIIGSAVPGSDKKRTLSVPADTLVMLDIQGMHRNPRYWNDPDTYNPCRFLDSDWPRDAFAPFALGPRACLGRRFAEAESVVLISRLIHKYRVQLAPCHGLERREGENMVAHRDRVLRLRDGITLTPLAVPLVFTPR